MIDGLWTAEFGSSTGMFGGGVVVFQSGKIMGGDATYFYTGDYTLKGNVLEAKLKVSPFIKGAESIFKTVGEDLLLELSGSLTDERTGIAQGHPQGKPDLNFGVRLVRRA